MAGITQIKKLLITGVVVLLGLLLVISSAWAHSGNAQRAFQANTKKTAIDIVSIRDLPPEVRTTLQRIKAGGAFPFAKDGVVFGNREHILPRRKHGYYREYTVPTPHVKNRGARRIIEGLSNEYYYTDDHYRSFRQIKE